MALQIEISCQLDVAVKHDPTAGCWVTYCPALDVYSAGKTEPEAKNAIQSALLMFIKNCFKRKILNNVLAERGFAPDNGEDDLALGSLTPLDAGEFVAVRLRDFGGDTFSVNVPMQLRSHSRHAAADCRV